MNQSDIHPRQIVRPVLLLAGILLIATNLRAPVTGIAPVLSMIQSAFTLNTAQAGFLTTSPLLAFAAISPFSVLIARQYGVERALFGALMVIVIGIVMRSLGPVWCLYLGTCLIGSGIAVGNVLLPSLLKRDFPHKIAAVTGAYAVTMGIAAALVSVAAVPLASAYGWDIALGAMVILPLAAIAFWIPQLGGGTTPASETPTPPHGGRIWHSALAWQVTLFMGLNSFLYYVLIGWLPSILATAGYSPGEAGTLHGVMQLSAGLPGFILGPIIQRMKDQKVVAAAVSLLAMIGLLGFLLQPGLATLWSICFGFGSGAGVILSLMFMGLRTGNPQQAAALSGMAQCVGYLLAAFGPPSIGALHDLSGGWYMPLAICVVLSIAVTVLGTLAGRAMQIGVPPMPRNWTRERVASPGM